MKSFSDEYERNGPTNGAGGFEHQMVIEIGDSPELQPCHGRTLAEIAADTGASVIETLCDLALKFDLELQTKSMAEFVA